MGKQIKNTLRNWIFRLAVLAALVFQVCPMPVHAALNITTPNKAWLRAKLTYEYDRGLTGLDDSIITFSSDKWKKSGDWYYYSDPVDSGQKVRFIDGVSLPTDWTSEQSDLNFRIIVTVEASEVASGEDGWNENKEAAYSQTFELWNSGYEHEEDIYVKQGNLTVTVNEYQLDSKGREVAYENDKVVLPGQFVSKIVEFQVGGEKGALIKLNPEKPVKTVMANNIDVDGKTVDAGTTLTYGITVKNPAPDTRTITIRDTLDTRLTLIDTCAGTLVSGSLGGQGGTIEWEVTVPGEGTYTVNFIAQTPEILEEGEGMSIPNTAEADIVGQTLESNTVLTHLGEVSPLDKLIAQARTTGDSSNVILYAVTIIMSAAALAVVFAAVRKKKKAKQ